MSINKKYYWMKMFDTFFQDPRVKKLKKLPGGDTYIVVMLKMMLQTIKTNGMYEFEGLENTLAQELELKLDEDEKAIQVVLDYMSSYKMILEIEKNQFQIPQVQKMIGSETAAAERKRNQRKRETQKLLKCDNVTHLSQEVTKCHTELEKELELEIDFIEREENKEIQEMLNSFKSELEIDEFLSDYISSLATKINCVDSFKHKLRTQIKNKDESTLKNIFSFYQKNELQKLQKKGA